MKMELNYKKICIFPNDPIISYYNKGEIKERYFNPLDTFDEVHIISFTDKDIDEEKVQILAGKAKLKIHSVGKINLFNKSKMKKKIITIVKNINPNIIRAHNPLLEGWIAANCSKILGIPLFVSVHIEYDGLRKIAKKSSYKKFLALKWYRKKIEPYVLNNADKITVVYKIIEPYVFDICGKKPEILYNRIDLQRFKNGIKQKDYDKPLILSVGRLTPQKNPHLIINAIKDLDVYLMMIGDGELSDSLKNLVTKLNIENKVIFKKSVPNNEIQNFYKSADIFILCYEPDVEGVPIPVLEAMAAGLPVIITKPISGLSDGLEKSVAFTELDPKSIKNEIMKLIEDRDYLVDLSHKAQEKSVQFDGKVTEKRESNIYMELLSSKKLP
jgi:glycosyltransferase involved in cell wall biosynthesis